MKFPDAKALKKLADACRKAGIYHFKTPEFEFTLTDINLEPTRAPRKNAKVQPKADLGPNEVVSDGLSEEELLFWSTTPDSTQPPESA